jgi:ABC-type phosphate transport system ATPase subunit
MMRFVMERKTQLEEELEMAEQAVATWEELLAKLHLQSPELSSLQDETLSSAPVLKE